MDPSDVPPKLIPDKKIIKRIPGKIPTPSPKEKDGYVDLKKMSVPALKELLQRQVGILSSRLILNKLADKGERVLALKKQIEDELKQRDEVNQTANLLSQMSLQQLNNLEWTSNINPGHINRKTVPADAPEDNQDPLHIIATHSGVYNHEKLVVECAADTLVTPADIIDCSNICESVKDRVTSSTDRPASPAPSTSSSVTSDLELQLHTARICEKYDKTTGKERFKPNKLSKSSTKSLETMKISKKESKRGGLWDESSAAPPFPVHGDAKILTLQESLALQQEQTERLKYIQTKHAAERLMSLQGLQGGSHLPASISSSMAFREKRNDSGESDNEDKDSAAEEEEVYDDEPEDGPTVVCTVLS